MNYALQIWLTSWKKNYIAIYIYIWNEKKNESVQSCKLTNSKMWEDSWQCYIDIQSITYAQRMIAYVS